MSDNAARSTGTSQVSTAELVRQAGEQISRLVRDELALAKAELAEKGKRAGVGVGLFGGRGVVALYGVAALLAAVVLGLFGGAAAMAGRVDRGGGVVRRRRRARAARPRANGQGHTADARAGGAQREG